MTPTTIHPADIRPSTPLSRPPHARTGLYAPAQPSVIIPPPMRRETAQRPAWRPGDVVLPALCDDSALPHEATDAPDASGIPHEADGAL